MDSEERGDCELRIANRAKAAGPTDSTSVEAAPIGLNWTGQWGHFFAVY